MDKVSLLLNEAKPLYIAKERQKKAFISSVVSFCLVLAVWNFSERTQHFDEDGFDSYFTALYLNDDISVDDGAEDLDLIPLDRYGLYEV